MEERKERRRHPRRSVAARVAVMWENDGGVSQWAWGRCFDVSESGARFQVSRPIPASKAVYVRIADLLIDSYGVVRHSSIQGTVGVEFNLPLSHNARFSLDREPPKASK
jgi:hypothetical protein